MPEQKKSMLPLHPAAVHIALHLGRHPVVDYLPQGSRQMKTATGPWTAVHRNHQKRQLVDIQEVENDCLQDLRSLANVSSCHIAHPIAIYYYQKRVFFIQEHVALSVLELGPLCDPEIAYVFAQVLNGLQHLLVLGIGFRVACVRTTVAGDVKIVLDWGYEPNISPLFKLAGTSYLAVFLRDLFMELRGPCRDWSADACDFVRILEAGYLPASTVSLLFFRAVTNADSEQHSFLSQASSVRSTAWFAMQQKLAASSTCTLEDF
ncbi:uncharacterized protein BBA_09454 [Beauveria bassiana ARSEF 2860]|uniref:Uncharacterized protein n=1 Tax=Beauveria bassiana (strain ARSEF 2860) TaxID=655819 RepID=J5JCL8_BEAB2|nr:uncharacterized protein BBA_09454 [Beauveria bassiana ARSEF 2860]EJP61611.1 hypothetical protein BBA_09454 [Beauveria bassiana ARSEF 2860]